MSPIVLGTLGPMDGEGHARSREELRRLEQVNAALVARVEQVAANQSSGYSLFETAIQLESRVRRRTIELSQTLERLEQSNRENIAAREAADEANRSKTKFLAGAGHDILQPLNAARLFLSALVASGVSEEGGRYAANIETALDTIEDLISSVLVMSRLDAGVVRPEFAEVSLRDLIESVTVEFRPMAERKGLELRAFAPDLVVRSDPAFLKRILSNLVSNAVRYTRRGGVLVGARRRAGHIRLDVFDTGIGIAADQQGLVFQEFHRGIAASDRNANDANGLGLGLSIVSRLAEALGHPLHLTSVVGRGTHFSITLPVAKTLPREVRRPGKGHGASGFGLAMARILVIENDRDVAEATLDLLERWSCVARSASDGDAAIAIMETSGFAPDVVLADLHLDEGRTGLEAIAAIRRASGRSVPAIVLTADRSPAAAEAVAAAGCELVLKPVRPAELRALLAHMTA